jgi:TPR repeat protein
VDRWAASPDKILAIVPNSEELSLDVAVYMLQAVSRIVPMSLDDALSQDDPEAFANLIDASRIAVIADRWTSDPVENLSGRRPWDRARLVLEVEKVSRGSRGVSVLHKKDMETLDLSYALRDVLPQQAIDLLREKADAGLPDALSLITVIAAGPPEPDVTRWQEALIATADAHWIGAAATRLEDRQESRAVDLHQAAADLGDVRSMGRLIVLLAAKDPQASLTWQEKLLDRNDPQVVSDVAEWFKERDPKRALTLYQAAAKAGNSSAATQAALLTGTSPKAAPKDDGSSNTS